MTNPLDFNDYSKVPSEFTTDATPEREKSYTELFAEIERINK